MSTGRNFWSWNGRPAISQDGQVRYVAAAGGPWTSDAGATVATLAAQAMSIGRDVFDQRFAGPPWNLPDLVDTVTGTVWYQRPETLAAQPFDWARARLYAR